MCKVLADKKSIAHVQHAHIVNVMMKNYVMPSVCMPWLVYVGKKCMCFGLNYCRFCSILHLFFSLQGRRGRWDVSSSEILQMNSETGVAFAKNSGMVVVYYRLEGGQQTFKEVISASAQLHKCSHVL